MRPSTAKIGYCTVCGGAFYIEEKKGRPPLLCGEKCRKVRRLQLNKKYRNTDNFVLKRKSLVLKKKQEKARSRLKVFSALKK